MASKICSRCNHKMNNIGPFEDSKSVKNHNNIMILNERRGVRFQCPHCYYVEENILKDRHIYKPTQPPDLTNVKDYNRVILAIGKNRRHGPKLRRGLAIPSDELQSRLMAMVNKGLCCFELALEKGPIELIWVWLPQNYTTDILDATHSIDYESTVKECSILLNDILTTTPNTIAGERLCSICEIVNMEDFKNAVSVEDKPIPKSLINKLSRIHKMLLLTRLIIECLVDNSPTTHADIREKLSFSTNDYQSARNSLEEVLGIPLVYFGVFGKTTKNRTTSLPPEMNLLLDETELNLRKMASRVLSERNRRNESINIILPANVLGFARSNLIKKLTKRGLSRSAALNKADSILQDNVSSENFLIVLEQIQLSHYLPIFMDSSNWPYFSPILGSLEDVKRHFNIIVDTRNVIKHGKSDPIDIISVLNSFLWLHLKMTPYIA